MSVVDGERDAPGDALGELDGGVDGPLGDAEGDALGEPDGGTAGVASGGPGSTDGAVVGGTVGTWPRPPDVAHAVVATSRPAKASAPRSDGKRWAIIGAVPS